MSLLSAIVSFTAAASDPGSTGGPWPEFRGPGRSGIAAGGDFPVDFGPNTNVLWSVPVPGGHSSPVLWGDRLILTGFETNQLVVMALDRRSGKPLWRTTVEPGTIESGSRLSHPATATPSTDGERCVAYFASFGLLATDADGRELWRHPLPTPVTQHGASSSPVIAGDCVVQLCDQDVDSYLLAVDKRTGKPRWKVSREAFRRGFSTPLPWPPEHPTQVVVAGTLRLVAYEVANGTERWSVRGLPNEMVASPVTDGDRIYVAGWTHGSGVPRMPEWLSLTEQGDANRDGQLTREEAPNGPARQHFAYIDADKDGQLTRQEYESLAAIFNEAKNVAMAIRPNGDGDVTRTHIDWRQERGLPYVPSPLVYDGRMYLVKNGGLISCLHAKTGAFLFQEERLGALGDYYSSPVAAGGKVLTISQAGIATVIRAGDALEILARNSLGEPVLATPAIGGTTLYIRTQTKLFAFVGPPVESVPTGSR
ncbi:MAG: PQQ-binding-like beta-propeller repeat protein [Verrucomicrobiales bacterium]|nr:PQQ-binding-like beta-propeller repeat protein [Verrucomicrobiales bacterium]